MQHMNQVINQSPLHSELDYQMLAFCGLCCMAGLEYRVQTPGHFLWQYALVRRTGKWKWQKYTLYVSIVL